MRRAALGWLAAALLGCETRFPCPGEPVATLHFQNDPAGTPSSTCLGLASAGSVDFTGTVVRRAGQAVLCVQRPLAQEKVGTLDASDALAVSSADLGLTIGSCPCPIDSTELLSGTLQRTSGVVDAFRGALVATLKLQSSCAPGASSACEPLALAPGSATALLAECTVVVPLRAPPAP